MAPSVRTLGVIVTLQKALQVIRQRFAPMLGIVVVGYVATFLPTALFLAATGGQSAPDTPANTLFGIFSAVISLFVSSAVQGALQHIALGGLAGRKVPFGEAFKIGIRRMTPLAGINFLLFAALFLASIFFLAPALFLLSMWFVAIPAQIEEKTGVLEAFSRSRVLTYGNRWRILGIFGLILLVFLVLLMIFSMLLGLVGFVGPIIMGLIFYTTLPMVFVAVGAATYRSLRRIAGEDDQIAEVFA